MINIKNNKRRIILIGVLIVSYLTVLGWIHLFDTKYGENQDIWVIDVGINNYANSVHSSKYGANDAIDLFDTFLKFIPNDRITLLTDDLATKYAIKNAIMNWLSPKEKANSTVVIYLSGHGDQDHFCTYDSLVYSNENDISYLELSDWLNELESKNVIIIMDFCYSYEYANKISNVNRNILTCGSSGQLCWESKEQENGVFSQAIIKSMKDLSNTDINKDSQISMQEFYETILEEVKGIYLNSPPPSNQDPQFIGREDAIFLY
jgi:hypothetical protein